MHLKMIYWSLYYNTIKYIDHIFSLPFWKHVMQDNQNIQNDEANVY